MDECLSRGVLERIGGSVTRHSVLPRRVTPLTLAQVPTYAIRTCIYTDRVSTSAVNSPKTSQRSQPCSAH